MREIKFRVWHKPTNQFVRCHPVWNDKQYKDLGLLSLTSDGQLIFETMYDGFQRLSDSNEVDDFIVQQYTGLKDKNGVEIYEGDLLTHRSLTTIFLVDFNNENYGHVMGWNLLDYGYFKDGIFSECEKVEYSNSNTVNYPVSEYYYGQCPTNNEIDGLDPYYEVVGNIFEGVDK